MARGKAAARNANRRTREVEARLTQTDTRYKADLEQGHREIVELKDEVRRLRSGHLAEAGKIADAEVKRLLKKAAEERRAKGLSDDTVINFAAQKDRLIANACRYISMTTGRPPLAALPLVIAWCTDKPFYGLTKTKISDFLLSIGVMPDGWTAMVWKDFGEHYEHQFARSAKRRNAPAAIGLQQAETEGHPDIHPDYDAKWYKSADHIHGAFVDYRASAQEGAA